MMASIGIHPFTASQEKPGPIKSPFLRIFL